VQQQLVADINAHAAAAEAKIRDFGSSAALAVAADINDAARRVIARFDAAVPPKIEQRLRSCEEAAAQLPTVEGYALAALSAWGGNG
jgi:precorrin-2 methylase